MMTGRRTNATTNFLDHNKRSVSDLRNVRLNTCINNIGVLHSKLMAVKPVSNNATNLLAI